MGESIHVVVHVHYDHYRYQDNWFASKNKQECLDYINSTNKHILWYEYNLTTDSGSDYENTLRHREQEHFWIQEFK